jgi:membrane protein
MKIKQTVSRWLMICGKVIKFSAKRYAGNQQAKQAIVLTYYTLFSIVPLAALLFGIAKGFALDEQLLNAIYDRFPDHHEFVDYIREFAEKTLQQSSGGVVAGVGVIALFWTVIWLINNIEKAFNMVWGLPPRKNVFRKFSSYLSLVLITPIMMVAISTFGVMLRNRLNDLSERIPEWSVTRWCLESMAGVAPIIASCILFFIIYWFVPNTKVRWRGACVAGIIAGVCFQVLQDSFLFLQSSVFSYNRIYGSFAMLPLFLVWVNWSWQIILFGAEICFVQQHLRSGVFNEPNRKMSLKLRREHQMAIVSIIYREFDKGGGPVAEEKIATDLRLPDVIMRSEVAELIDCGMICRSISSDGRVFFLPGLPPDKYTVIDFLRSLNGQGDTETPEFAKFELLFSKMENAVEKSELNVKIHEI